jgi:Ser/Thr protein kinase RdoA (MazF antagonist)
VNAVVEKALTLWGLTDSTYSLVAARENAVFRVDANDQSFALRVHRKGYRSNAELWSELVWMAAAKSGGLDVPDPVPSLSGAFLHEIHGVQVDALTWLPGAPLQDLIGSYSPTKRAEVFYRLGRQMAQLHQICDAWEIPAGFARPAWDRKGLLGAQPLWGRFWENPELTDQDRQLFNLFRDLADKAMRQYASDGDYGLIHADLVSQNILIGQNRLYLIDFDDGGYGFRLFELATALLRFIDDADYASLRSSLLHGYSSARTLNTNALDLFLAIRAVTYVGWNISRLHEAGGQSRNKRFIDTARQLARSVVGAS